MFVADDLTAALAIGNSRRTGNSTFVNVTVQVPTDIRIDVLPSTITAGVDFNMQGQILDDDGFLLKNNKIYHLKVKNSIEGNCRGNKVGHCFNFNIKELEVKKVLIGNIEIDKNSLKIRYLGCSQKYLIQKNIYFFKVFPDKKNCFWTKEKNYYVRKWNGKLFLN